MLRFVRYQVKPERPNFAGVKAYDAVTFLQAISAMLGIAMMVDRQPIGVARRLSAYKRNRNRFASFWVPIRGARKSAINDISALNWGKVRHLNARRLPDGQETNQPTSEQIGSDLPFGIIFLAKLMIEV